MDNIPKDDLSWMKHGQPQRERRSKERNSLDEAVGMLVRSLTYYISEGGGRSTLLGRLEKGSDKPGVRLTGRMKTLAEKTLKLGDMADITTEQQGVVAELVAAADVLRHTANPDDPFYKVIDAERIAPRVKQDLAERLGITQGKARRDLLNTLHAQHIWPEVARGRKMAGMGSERISAAQMMTAADVYSLNQLTHAGQVLEEFDELTAQAAPKPKEGLAGLFRGDRS